MKRSLTPRLLFVLILLTAVLAALHLSAASETAPGTLVLAYNGHETVLTPDPTSAVTVEGKSVNGRGEVREVHAEGWPFSSLLQAAGFDPQGIQRVSVLAADGYSAAVSGAEILEEGKVFLLKGEGSSFRLVVFGDENSRRNVKDVIRLIPEEASQEAVPAA